MSSIFYKHPELYNLFINLIHGSDLKKRYEFIASEIGENKRVFELGCGSCKIHNFLLKGCSYKGWDLNQVFVNHALKKGLKVEKKNIFDFKNYPDCDVVLIIDVLHHLCPRHERFLKEVVKKNKKLIVLEPYNLPKRPSFLDKLFGDYDGINQADRLNDWDYGKEELNNFFKKNGAKKVHEFGKDLIAIF